MLLTTKAGGLLLLPTKTSASLRLLLLIKTDLKRIRAALMNADAVQFKMPVLGSIFPPPVYCIRCHMKRAPLFPICAIYYAADIYTSVKREVS